MIRIYNWFLLGGLLNYRENVTLMIFVNFFDLSLMITLDLVQNALKLLNLFLKLTFFRMIILLFRLNLLNLFVHSFISVRQAFYVFFKVYFLSIKFFLYLVQIFLQTFLSLGQCFSLCDQSFIFVCQFFDLLFKL